MGYLMAGDTISGQEATAKLTVNNPNGSTTVEDLFYCKKLEATCELTKTTVKTLGKRGEQSKPTGWKGSGSFTIFYITTRFRNMVLQYIKTGVPVYFDILVTNEDPASGSGSQTVVIKNCSLDKVILAKFDVDSDVLDEDMDFTFDDAEVLDDFDTPTLG